MSVARDIIEWYTYLAWVESPTFGRRDFSSEDVFQPATLRERMLYLTVQH